MQPAILVVEDAPDCRESLEIALAGIGNFRVLSTASAEEALIALAKNEIGAVVTDLNLPNMDGIALIEKIRLSPACVKLPIVVTSGDTTAATRARLTQLKIDAFFAKPYSPGQVRRTLEQLIHAKKIDGD